MKRAEEDICPETYLYWLPHELLVEILKIVFSEVGGDLTATHTSFRTRRTCRLIKQLIEREILGAIKTVPCYKTVKSMSDTAFSYMTGLTNLTVPRGSNVSDDGIRCLTRLEELNLSYTKNTFTNQSVQSLCCLRKLRLISQPPEAGRIDFSLLSSSLETLWMDSNTVYRDDDLRVLTSLKSLALYHDYALSGECLYSMTKLQTLVLIGDLMLSPVHLERLSSRLIELDLSYNTRIQNATLVQMTRLEKLSLANDLVIADETLKQLTNLRELDLSVNDMITDDGLSTLKRLTSLDLTHNRHITTAGILACSTTLKRIILTSSKHIIIHKEALTACQDLEEILIHDSFGNGLPKGIKGLHIRVSK